MATDTRRCRVTQRISLGLVNAALRAAKDELRDCAAMDHRTKQIEESE